MYRIALCDDETSELRKTSSLLNAYKPLHPNCDFTVQQFTLMDELIEDVTQNGGFDLLLLDVYMPQKTGIQGAKELRRQGIDCPIIFLTTSLDHAVDAFGVDAVQYMIKPVNKAHLFTALNKAFVHIDDDRNQYITLPTGSGLCRVALRNIIYCESHGNYQYVSIANNTKIRVRMTLAELQALVIETNIFVRVGIAYLVNLNHVDSLSAKGLELDNNEHIGVPRGAFPTLKKQYFEFYCTRKEQANGPS